jgi:hypothetical protein
MDSFLLVDKLDTTTEIKECDKNIIVKHYTGINTDNFVIKKMDGKRLTFSFFKINGIYYVNLNGDHIIDYKRFTSIQFISKVTDDSIRIKNSVLGEIIIQNCDTELFQKALNVMSKHMKTKSSYFSDLLYFFFN